MGHPVGLFIFDLNSLFLFLDAVKDIYIYVAVSLAVSILVLILVLSSLVTLWLKYRGIRRYKNNNEKKFKKRIESIAVSVVFLQALVIVNMYFKHNVRQFQVFGSNKNCFGVVNFIPQTWILSLCALSVGLPNL